MTSTAAPRYLTGHMAPVPDEISAVDLPVEGALPPELTGRYLRNGPNPLPGQDPGHWFAGHGMIHGVRLRDGRAEWYRNRWVRTGALAGRSFMGPDGFDRTAVVANTHVIEHGGALLALVENGFPYEVTRELDTVGPCDFGGRLTTAMTAHPKADPQTGALHFFGYSAVAPHLVYHRLSADNVLECSVEVPGAGPSMMHDFAVTDRHALFLDLPMVFSLDRLDRGLPYGWDADYPARIGVMPLDRPGEVTWVPVDPCYVFHVGGAHTGADGRIVLDACRYGAAGIDRLWGSIGGGSAGAAADAASTGSARLHRWTIDPVAGTATEAELDDRPAEFPTFDDRLVGRPARHLYTVSERGDGAAVVKYDHATGEVTSHELGPDAVTGEAVFVPARGGTAEDDGWLISITTRRDGGASQLLVLDATDVAGAPVAVVELPRGVPMGFHGSWIPDE
jgi:carotenoid cleavage dioxygenase-like enzyme